MNSTKDIIGVEHHLLLKCITYDTKLIDEVYIVLKIVFDIVGVLKYFLYVIYIHAIYGKTNL